MTPVYKIQSEILELLDEWKEFVWGLDMSQLMKRKGKFFRENRSKYATSIECLNSMEHDTHDGFPPDSHGYDFNQIATWVKHDDLNEYSSKYAKAIQEKSQWIDKELGAILGVRFCALKMFYPKDGYIAWHNNWNVPGYNVLFTFTETGNGFWRHINPAGSKGKINKPLEKNLVHIPDVPGWHMKTGYYGKKEEEDKIMWHSAYGGEPRMTLGYVVYNEDLWKNMVEDIAGKELVWPLAPFNPSMLPENSPSYMPEDNIDAHDG